MYTPYDWQEAIGHRAQFIESKLALGTPVIAASCDAGVLMFTLRRQSRKVFEVYDRLIMGAIGQQSDIEAVRLAAIDFCHREGYAHSEEDVTLHRLMNAISAPIKRAFADFSSAPIVASSLFGEVGTAPEDDQFAVMDYDGDYRTSKVSAFVAADPNLSDSLHKKLSALELAGKTPEEGIAMLQSIWESALKETASRIDGYEPEEGLRPEGAILLRKPMGESRYRHVSDNLGE
ncbi:MAG: hypothetical protein HZC36_15840 [Armatimonadetes bacterium]|nr:hypothetical protein [Armatimonadota bacterium]